MTFSLTKKIVIPYALIGVLVLAMVITLQIMNARVGSLIGQEQDLARVRQAVHQVASEVKSGILTRSEASAIEVARIALSADETLSRLERAGADAKLLHSAFEDYFAGVVAINSVYLENRTEEGNKRLGKLREQERDIDTAVERAMEAVRAQHQRLETLGNSFQGLALLVLLAAIVLVSLFVRRQVVRPIREMAHTLEGIAQGKGDLTARITVKNQDEIGDIARAFNAMLGNLAKMIGDTVETARQVGTSAEHLASAIVQVRSSSIAQGESAATIAAAVEELTVSVNHVASLAHDSEKTATGAADVSEEGVKLAARSAEKAQIMESSGEHMAALATQLATESGKIHQLVAVIHEIADQTNLLALNAAIEAARAGEQGRGFAVVADEVRKLAERTNTEIATIRSIVDGMNQVVNGISSAIASNAGDEREESEIARKVSDIFAGVGQQAANTAKRVRDIAYAMAEQATATTDIARNVETVAQMAEENSSAVDSVNNSAAQLKALAQQLQGLLAGFRY